MIFEAVCLWCNNYFPCTRERADKWRGVLFCSRACSARAARCKVRRLKHKVIVPIQIPRDDRYNTSVV